MDPINQFVIQSQKGFRTAKGNWSKDLALAKVYSSEQITKGVMTRCGLRHTAISVCLTLAQKREASKKARCISEVTANSCNQE